MGVPANHPPQSGNAFKSQNQKEKEAKSIIGNQTCDVFFGADPTPPKIHKEKKVKSIEALLNARASKSSSEPRESNGLISENSEGEINSPINNFDSDSDNDKEKDQSDKEDKKDKKKKHKKHKKDKKNKKSKDRENKSSDIRKNNLKG